jgi:murein DD-endopeptidase MepM/ murein hydrolase activator NlpD
VIRTAALTTLALALPAGAFDLQQPIACTLGDDCYIQQYFDHDPGPSATDFTCGPLSYDGHDGTDFALPTRAMMEDGVSVLSAASGKVVATRDGDPDFAPAVPGRECGNGVVIDHGQGWQTQYCHLKQGSLLVSKGEEVAAGDQLGLVGQSGKADFPHVHLSVRRNGVEIDPFAPDAPACGTAGDDLWSGSVLVEEGGLLDIGIATSSPDFAEIKAGLDSPDLPATAPALVVWAFYFGPRAGDEIALTLTGPNGEVVSTRARIEKTQALAMRFAGAKPASGSWPAGEYHGTATLFREGKRVDQRQITIQVGP